MNAKKMKKIRKLARHLTVGQPPVHYIRGWRFGPITVAEGCTRFVIKKLKREMSSQKAA